MEAAIFAYQLLTFDDVLTLTRWVHDRLNDCRCYFYQDESLSMPYSHRLPARLEGGR
jgi:hypothetical protein